MALPTEWLPGGLVRRAPPPFGEGRPTPSRTRVRTVIIRSLGRRPEPQSGFTDGEEEGWGGVGCDSLVLLFGCGRPCDPAAVPAVPRLEGAPDSVHRQSSRLQLSYSDVYPQCKLCRRPSRFFRCRSWTGLTFPLLRNARCAVLGCRRHLCRGAEAVSLGPDCSESHSDSSPVAVH